MTEHSPSPAGARRRWLRPALMIGALTLAVTAVVVLYKAYGVAPPPARAVSIGARLELASGEVTVDEAGKKTNAISGTPLTVGARVKTGKGARALVRAGDGAALFLRGETEIVLDAKGLRLESGETWIDAPRLDEREAIACTAGPHAVAASDAGLSVQRAGDDVTVYVARGLAILTSPGGRAEINAGEQATAKGTGAPAVAPVAFWQDWTGGMGDARPVHAAAGRGAGRIYGLDPSAPAGSPARKLGIAKQIVRAVVRDGVAETEVDQTFSNPSGSPIEGWYWFTVPPSAIVTSFALETNGELVEGEVIERREAAAQYASAVRQANDPALLEWVDGQSYRARIYPIPSSGTRRVVLRYMELLPAIEGKTRYVYPLRTEEGVRFDEFALSIDLGSNAADLQVATSLDATVEQSGRRVTMRRSGYVPHADFQLELTPKKAKPPVRAWRFSAGSDQADYVMLRYVPDRDVSFAALPTSKAELVLVVDTSAGGDASARAQRTAAAEAVLRALSDQDRFALVALDVSPTVVYPAEGLAAATDANVAAALEKLSGHGVTGATDLGAMFEPALERLHGTEQPALVYVGDGVATSGETGAEALLARMRRSLSGSRARFFAVGVGVDAHHDLLQQLTRAGGGRYLRIDEAEQTTGQALNLSSAIKTPTITDLELDLGAGLDQPFYSVAGKLARGQELLLLARTHHALPNKVLVKGRVGGKDFKSEYPLDPESDVTTSLVPRLWAAEYVRRLLGGGPTAEDNRAKVLDLGLEYALMTPYTSILALDSESAYARQGIRRRNSKLRGARLSQLDEADHSSSGPFLFPASLTGCDRKAAPEAAPTTAEAKEMSGEATRARGEEGRMANAPAPPVVAASGGLVPMDLPAADEKAKEAPAATATAQSAPVDLAAKPETARDGHRVARPGGGGGAGDPMSTAAPGAKPAEPPSPRQANETGRPDGDRGVDNLRNIDARQRAQAAPAKTTLAPQPWKPVLSRCSDAASRSLFERIVLWQQRLTRASGAGDLVLQYEAARAACELPDWRDQAALLDLLQAKISTEQGASQLLSHLAREPEAQRFVARAILRRTVDVRIAAAVSRALYGDRVDWVKVDRELLDMKKPEERRLHLKAMMLAAPGDPQGDVRLVKMLVETGERQEALAHGRRLRDRGMLTPTLAQQLGDVLAASDAKDEALRTYSEIVEFDRTSPTSRMVLGDVFLRNGWYGPAYRQYKTLTDLDPKSAVAWLRLAGAAAGSGRIDEALRIDREVMTGQGSPGPDDPRYWAKLWSAARLATLLADPKSIPADPRGREGVSRKLKELGLFSGPGALALLTWEDHAARLSLGAADPTKETLTGEATNAGAAGLYAVLVGPAAWEKTSWAVRWASDAPGRGVAYAVLRLTWDGQAFAVHVSRGKLEPGAKPAPF